ncbi:MAG TPA: plastocyanin/azurin family copper-binding protein [Thermoleophilaceae bacterium]|nr:plastocyanin/azurin family copper-binding protein [Thermoleophilaceae bacterium]
MSRTSVLAGVALVALLMPAGAAHADERIQAGPSVRYTTPTVTMDQGERLTFQNVDLVEHDVTANGRGPDGRPLFRTPVIGSGQEAFVEGSQYLTTGSYGFFCTVHPEMTGTLNVTSAGTPVPRPADTTAPRASVRVGSARVSRVRRARRLAVRVTVNEAATVALRATARRRLIARGTVTLNAPGSRSRALALTAAGRRAVRAGGRLAVTVTARAVDRAGNARTARTRRTLRP